MKWKWKENANKQEPSDEDFYALCNGYIIPEDMLADSEQVKAVISVRALLESFFSEARNASIIEEM